MHDQCVDGRWGRLQNNLLKKDSRSWFEAMTRAYVSVKN